MDLENTTRGGRSRAPESRVCGSPFTGDVRAGKSTKCARGLGGDSQWDREIPPYVQGDENILELGGVMAAQHHQTVHFKRVNRVFRDLRASQ